MIERLEPVLRAERPDLVLVPGDVNSTLAAALCAQRCGIAVGHVESGLRSFDRTMPEEVNRIVTDHLSELLFTHSPEADDNLRAEGIDLGKAALRRQHDDRHARRARGADPRARRGSRLGLEPGSYLLVTLHRPALVDGPAARRCDRCARRASARCCRSCSRCIRGPARCSAAEPPASVRLVDPVGYLDFLSLEADAAAVLTDSGGIQEETTYLGIPCFTLRDNTERPVTVRAGTNTLLGLAPERIAEIPALLATAPATRPQPPEKWDGHAAERLADGPRGLVASRTVRCPRSSPSDRVFFDLFNRAGPEHAATPRALLKQMLEGWPETKGLAREILLAEQEGDKITHEIVHRVNTTFVTPIDGGDIYGLATQLDDIVDYIEETADFMGLYRIEAPMEQSLAMADVLVRSLRAARRRRSSTCNGFKDLDQYWIEIHRLENEGDRLYRDAVASLFANGIDPMFVIRWRDIFLRLERAVDATETAAHILEGIVIKNASVRRSEASRAARR